MKPSDDIKKFFKNAAIDTNPKVDETVLDEMLNEHDKAINKQLATDKLNIWRIIMKSRITKLATAAVIIVAVIISFNQFIGPTTNVALAEVTSRFAQVDYLHVYFLISRGDVFSRKFEGWYAHGKLVMRGDKGDMVYDDGQTQQTFNKQGRRVSQEPSFFAEGQTFVEVFTAGLLSDKNELLSRQMPTNVGDDFLIYEFDSLPDKSDSYVESIYITVGKNSLLPVQAKLYHEDGDYDLIMFDYEAPEKLPEFFELPMVDAPNGRGEVVLDGEEVMIDIEGAPGLKHATVRLHSKYEKKGVPIFKLDVTFITEEGYRSGTNDVITLRSNEARQCGVGSENGGLDNWPDGKYRNVRFSPLLKSTDREDTYIVEIRCWLRPKDN